MSGSSIGGVIGGAVGFYFGGPAGAQYGFMIGSAIGGYVDPQRIEGPRITDAQTQTSMEGAPRTIVYGTCCVAGNLIQWGPLVEHKNTERQGKGGPKVTTYTYTRTVAIRICEAAPLGGSMKLRRVWMDDKLVYDVSARDPLEPFGPIGDLITVESQSFASILTFYDGSEDQLPDPSLEALDEEYGGGVGNVPAYRGTCYAVLTDLDCTDRQGSVPQFRWEVCSEAESVIVETKRYIAPEYSWFGNAEWPLLNPESDYTIIESGIDGLTGTYTFSTESIAAGIAEDTVGYPAWGTPTEFIGTLKGGPGPYSTSAVAMEGHGASNDLETYYQVWLLYNWEAPVAFQDTVKLRGGSGGTVPADTGGNWNGDALGVVFRSYTSHDATTTQYGVTGEEGFNPHYVKIETKKLVPTDKPQPGEFLLPDVEGYVSDVTGSVRKLGGAAEFVAGSFRTLATEVKSGAIYLQREIGPVLAVGDDSDTEAYWQAAYDDAVAEGLIPAGKTYLATGNGGIDTFPRNRSGAYQVTTNEELMVTPGKVSLPAIVSDLASRTGIDSDQLDLSALTGMEVRGYPVARQTTADAAIRELQQVFFFDLPEWGNSGDTGTKLRAVLRGGEPAYTLTEDDLADNDDDEDTRPQQVEYPRKVWATASDPEANYEAVSEPAERETENVKAVGEVRMATSVVLVRDEIKQLAEKSMKTRWAAAEGRTTQEVIDALSQYTPSDVITFNDKRYRIDRTERRDGSVVWEMERDRASAATSTATGSNALPPSAPAATVRGPTLFQVLNLPSLRSADNVPGVYIAAQGRLPGWIGADIYLSVDGGVTEQKIATITDPATMGVLAEDTDADGNDSSGLISVTLYKGGELDSITEAQMDARLNGFVLTTSGVSEVGQFQYAEETSTSLLYDLSNVLRGQLGTTAATHSAGDSFVLLDGAVLFIPVDAIHAGETLIFRAVSIGTAPANNPTTSIVFDPPVFIYDGGDSTT